MVEPDVLPQGAEAYERARRDQIENRRYLNLGAAVGSCATPKTYPCRAELGSLLLPLALPPRETEREHDDGTGASPAERFAGQRAVGDELTTERAGWSFSSLRVASFDAGGLVTIENGEEEALVLPLEGSCAVESVAERLELSGRQSVFAGTTDFAYVGRHATADNLQQRKGSDRTAWCPRRARSAIPGFHRQATPLSSCEVQDRVLVRSTTFAFRRRSRRIG